jgi:hypothetical protein
MLTLCEMTRMTVDLRVPLSRNAGNHPDGTNTVSLGPTLSVEAIGAVAGVETGDPAIEGSLVETVLTAVVGSR